MSNTNWMVGALVAALGATWGASAQAQDPATPAPAAEQQQEDDAAKPEESKHPMGWIGLGLKLGVAGVGSGKFETANPAYDPTGALSGAGVGTGVANCPITSEKCSISSDSRTGFQLTLAITMGGDGFGWDLDPYLNFAGSGTAMGMYTGPKFDIHVMDPLYIGFGFGLKAAYVKADGFDYAADLYGRIPLRGTYYLFNDLGLIAELGIGYGASGYVALPSTNPATGKESDTKVNFGTAMTWDFTVGTRWP
jgi:hypothetical protein